MRKSPPEEEESLSFGLKTTEIHSLSNKSLHNFFFPERVSGHDVIFSINSAIHSSHFLNHQNNNSVIVINVKI